MRKMAIAILTMAAVLGPVTASTAAENVFVHSGDGDVEKIRLEDLADGETRTFGEGEHQVTATREGDRITIRFPRGGQGETETIDCEIGGHMCQVFVSNDDGARVFLVGDDSDANAVIALVDVDVEGIGEGHEHTKVMVRKQGDSIGWVGKPHGNRVVKIVELSGDPDVSLYECPEGDTTMRLSNEDTGPYFCPKHGLELEKSERVGVGHDVRVLVHPDVPGHED